MVLRCRVISTVARCGPQLNSGGKFGEGIRDPAPRVDIKAEYVVAAVKGFERRRALR